MGKNQPEKKSPVLVVEDVRVNQLIIRSMLSKLGLKADLANGREAIAALEDQPYEVVLMDWHMPEMDGITATKQIRQQHETLPQPWIIAVTANASPHHCQACLNAGMNDYLSKPLTLDQLLDALGRSPLSLKQQIKR